jgi:hypothetical protein
VQQGHVVTWGRGLKEPDEKQGIRGYVELERRMQFHQYFYREHSVI